MRYQAHLTIAGGLALTAGILTHNNVFDINKVIYSLSNVINFLGFGEAISNINNNTLIILLVSFMFSNLLNDLDNPKSIIGRTFFFISYPAWFLSVIIYMILYRKSWNGIGRVMGGGFSGLLKQMAVTHRVLFHSEIGLALLLWFNVYSNLLLGVNSQTTAIINVGIVLGYLTHLACDAISGKIPLPITLRLIFIMIGYKKETIGLRLG